MRTGYVDLDRQFNRADPSSDPEEFAFSSYLAGNGGAGSTWDELLKHRCVVVLGEAGSGKSWELEAQANKILASNSIAFFVRLDVLVHQSLRASLDSVERARFEKWLRGKAAATFFLDSVDEARLSSRAAFHAAISNFCSDLLGALNRVRTVVSCRVTEWHWTTDRLELERRLELPPSSATRSDDKIKAFQVFSIAPLDRARVEKLAGHSGVRDATIFSDAIEESDAWDFVARPGDVAAFAEYWLTKGRLGSLSEILEFTIDKRLRETPGREDDLPPKGARAAIEKLSAAVIFSRNFSLNTIHQEGQQLTGIDPKAVLVDWAPAEIGNLLQRAIFDGEHYGKIRFHHRSIAEYLAAKWLWGLKNLPTRSLLGLFFIKNHGRIVLVQSRAAVAAWLATQEGVVGVRIREELRKVSPETLIDKGDPQQLPIAFRQPLLEGLISKYASRARVPLRPEAAQLRRLATPELGPFVAKAVLDESLSSDIRELLLNLAAEGRLSKSVESALEILRKPIEGYAGLHFDALMLISKIGDQSQRRSAWEIVKKLNGISDAMCQLLIRDFYPGAIGINEILTIVQNSPPVRFDGVRHLEYGFRKFIEEGKFDGDLVALLSGFVDLMQKEPWLTVDGHLYAVSERHLWLDTTLVLLCRRVLSRKKIDAMVVEIVGKAASILAACKRVDHMHANKFDLHAESERHPLVRRSYVQNRLRAIERVNPGQLSRLRPLSNVDGVMRPSRSDIDWLSDELSSLRDPAYRKWLLGVAIGEWEWLRKPRGWLRRLRRAVKDDSELAQAIPGEFFPHARDSFARILGYFRYHLSWKVRDTWRKFGERRSDFVVRIRMLRDVQGIRTGKYDGWLRYLIHDREIRGSSSELSSISRTQLVEHYGRTIGGAAWEGLKQYWRKNLVPRKHDSVIPVGAIIGLAGVTADVEDGLDFASVDESLALKAAILGTHELNGFPPWYFQLSMAWPAVVTDVLRTHLEHEWQLPESLETVHAQLAKLRYDESGVRELLAPAVRDLLKNGDPLHPTVLSHAIGIVAVSPGTVRELIRWAPSNLLQYSRGTRQFATWLATWIAVDAHPALDFVEFAVDLLPSADADDLVGGLAASLSARRGGDLPELENPSYLRVAAIVRLIGMVSNHVRVSEDLDRANGGVYSPNSRDYAQEFRGTLFRLLADSKEKEAFSGLKALAGNPELSAHREWLLHLIDQRAQVEVETTPWLPTDLHLFSEKYEVAPRGANELNQLVLWRLQDLKDAVEDSDFPKRNIIDPKIADEYSFQVFVAREMEQASKGLYSVDRESEVGGRKEPDIRIRVPGIEPTTIEVKWADDWTLPQLERALTNQLVGDYLKAASSRFGILLVAYRGKKQHWGTLNFEELIDHLSSMAQTIMSTNERVDGVEIFAIDFSGHV